MSGDRCVDTGEHVGREHRHHVERLEVLEHLRRPARAGDDGAHARVQCAPRERQLGQRATEFLGDRAQARIGVPGSMRVTRSGSAWTNELSYSTLVAFALIPSLHHGATLRTLFSAKVFNAHQYLTGISILGSMLIAAATR